VIIVDTRGSMAVVKFTTVIGCALDFDDDFRA
jgi:hypothetical protein